MMICTYLKYHIHFQIPLNPVETVNGGMGIRNPLLGHSRMNKELAAQEISKELIYFI